MIDKILKWFKGVAKPWLIKNWMQIINFLVLLVAYNSVYGVEELTKTELILGLWIFILLAYYIFWKLFGAEKMFKK